MSEEKEEKRGRTKTEHKARVTQEGNDGPQSIENTAKKKITAEQHATSAAIGKRLSLWLRKAFGGELRSTSEWKVEFKKRGIL